MLVRHHRLRIIFATMNELKKPKFYSNHRYRQGQNIAQPSESNDNIKELLLNNKLNILDIGFGTGTSTKNLYSNDKNNYFCIESYMQGINNLKKYVKLNKIKNICIFYGDATNIISEILPDESIDEILIFFPDPWPKTKHHKRRLINSYTLNLFFSKLKKDGVLHFATDHIIYAYSVRYMLEKFTGQKILFNANRRRRPITNYERRGLKRKNFVFDLIVKKNN